MANRKLFNNNMNFITLTKYMDIQKSRLLADSSNDQDTFSQLNNHSSAINVKRPAPALNQIVAERKKGGNKLLFGFTVAVLMMIMGGSIFFAINQYQQSTTPSYLLLNN